MKREYYTHEGEHPEDRIFRDKQYINRLQKHTDDVFDRLCDDLGLNAEGKDWLFDYVFNEMNNGIDFEEYLDKYDVRYADIIDKKLVGW